MSVPRFSVSQITTMHWSFERDVAFLADAGVAAIGVSVRKLDDVGLPRAVRLVRDAGLAVSCLTSSGFFPLDDDAAIREALVRTRAHLGAASELGASCLFVLPGHAPALSWEESAARARPLLEAAPRRTPSVSASAWRSSPSASCVSISDSCTPSRTPSISSTTSDRAGWVSSSS